MKALILDLDGVVIRSTGYHHLNVNHFSKMRAVLDKWKKFHGDTVYFLTNRYAGELQPLAYYLGITSGFSAAENSAVIYDVAHNKIAIPKKYKEYAQKHVPQLRTFLADKLSINAAPQLKDVQFHPSQGYVKTLIIPPENESLISFTKKVKTVVDKSKFNSLFNVSTGKHIEVNPVNLSKKEGIEYIYHYNGLKNISPVFIADHIRDIPAAEEVVKRGGTVCAVGNADEEFKKFVKNANGIVAPSSTSYHQSVTYILNKLLNKN